MIATVTKEFSFEAAHSLPNLPEGHKCRNMHGHSYRFTVEVTGRVDDRGFVMDYAEIVEHVEPILKKLDHQNINRLFSWTTTAENLAKWIYEALKEKMPITRIILKETESTSVIYPAS